MKNNRRIELSEDIIAKHKLSTLSPPENSLFWKMWNANLDVAKSALETKFVQGIKSGSLDPVKYGGFNVNDAYYCFHGAEDYEVAANKATDPTLKAFLLKKYNSYVKYNATFPKIWRVKDANGVVPFDICKAYSQFETDTISGTDAIYALIVMLPCEYLWAWLGAQLAPPTKGNIYADWITGNNDPSGAYAMGNFIDLYQKKHQIDVNYAQNIYSAAMNYELGNFEAATD